MIRTIRRAFSTRVECDCGFGQSTSSDARADGIIRSHTCQSRPRSVSRTANRNSRND